VDGAGHQLLSHAALSEQQHRGVGRRRALDRIPDVTQHRALAHHLVAHFDGALQAAVLVGQAGLVERVANRQEHALARQRLLDEIERAGLRRFDRRADGPVSGDDHDRQRLRDAPDSLKRLQSIHPRHLHVEEDQIGRLLLDERDPLGAARRLEHVIAFVLEDHPHRPADLHLVVNDQNARLHRRASSHVSRCTICSSVAGKAFAYSTVTVTSDRCVSVGS
jgi:hypothetical protein